MTMILATTIQILYIAAKSQNALFYNNLGTNLFNVTDQL